jgi:hypothetical protein
MKKIQPKKVKNSKVFWLAEAARLTKKECFWGIIV